MEKITEPKLGKKIEIGGKHYKVVESETCHECALFTDCPYFKCSKSQREDGKKVVLVAV